MAQKYSFWLSPKWPALKTKKAQDASACWNTCLRLKQGMHAKAWTRMHCTLSNCLPKIRMLRKIRIKYFYHQYFPGKYIVYDVLYRGLILRGGGRGSKTFIGAELWLPDSSKEKDCPIRTVLHKNTGRRANFWQSLVPTKFTATP